MNYRHETEPHYVYHSLGLWWVRCGDINPSLEGPFMDRRDAIEQTESPTRHIVEH